MIKIDDYKILKDNMSTLKETSKDKHDNGTECFMTNSLLPVVNFDAVKDQYIRDLGICDSPKSNDALLVKSDGKSVFIEFKNGHMDRKKIFDVRKKVFDSVLIFTDIIGKGISYTREHTDYILVYNEQKNNDTDEGSTTRIQVSESRDQIAKGFMNLGHANHIKYGLEIFKNYCFKNVYTYTEDEFNSLLYSLK